MQYVTLPSITKPVSRLIYGTNAYLSGDDQAAAIACLDQAYALGFTTFDTAHSYGRSEENIGALDVTLTAGEISRLTCA